VGRTRASPENILVSIAAGLLIAGKVFDMATLRIGHTNTETQDVDIGGNDKIAWIILFDNKGNKTVFTESQDKKEVPE